MTYKQPRSIQVVIFAETAAGRELLLLRRVANLGGFWQPVTGSLEESETHAEAAVREVYEETGILCSSDQLIDLKVTNNFEIAPQWRIKYAPGITHNEEVCFALKVDKREVVIDKLEHVSWTWVDFRAAPAMLYWESNRRAFAALDKLLE